MTVSARDPNNKSNFPEMPVLLITEIEFSTIKKCSDPFRGRKNPVRNFEQLCSRFLGKKRRKEESVTLQVAQLKRQRERKAQCPKRVLPKQKMRGWS